MHLERFKDISTVDEFTDVDFTAKILRVEKPSETEDRLVIRFFDGYDNNRFIVYTDNKAVQDILYNNTVYLLRGTARGIHHRYFVLSSIELVAITLDIEQKYYPERFKRPTDMMKMTYDTSIAKIKDCKLRQFVGYCLGIVTTGYGSSDKQKIKYNKYSNAPASLNHHDSYPGGYIAHIAGMLSIVDALEQSYSVLRTEDISRIDWDLLRAIVYLHDIGKPLTYLRDQSGRYIWNEECLNDHAQLGAQHVYACWNRVRTVDFNLMQKLTYCINEHMNVSKPYDNKKVPELQLLRALDTLDSAIVTQLN